MGARAIDARWFRRSARPVKYIFPRPVPDDIYAALAFPPPSHFDELVGELARFLGRIYIEHAESPEYVGLSTILRVGVKQDG